MHGRPLDYAKRLDRSIRFIAANLDRPLTLAEIAAAAPFSPFHFHRIYRAALGETPQDTLRRLRLQRAAGDLGGGKTAIADIAARAGYGSRAAFGRAFAAAYGVTPAAYRAGARGASPGIPQARQELRMHRVDIVEQPARRLIGLAHKGPYIGIGEAFQRLSTWVWPRGLAAPDAICLGVFYDDPKSVAAAALRSDACIETGPGTSVEAPFRIVELQGGPHATVRFKGPYSDLEDVYAWMFGAWLPGSGREAADRPAFEIYRNSPANTPPADLLTDIYLPLA